MRSSFMSRRVELRLTSYRSDGARNTPDSLTGQRCAPTMRIARKYLE